MKRNTSCIARGMIPGDSSFPVCTEMVNQDEKNAGSRWTHESKRLARRGLAIGKDDGVEAFHSGADMSLCSSLVYGFVLRAGNNVICGEAGESRSWLSGKHRLTEPIQLRGVGRTSIRILHFERAVVVVDIPSILVFGTFWPNPNEAR